MYVGGVVVLYRNGLEGGERSEMKSQRKKKSNLNLHEDGFPIRGKSRIV